MTNIIIDLNSTFIGIPKYLLLLFLFFTIICDYLVPIHILNLNKNIKYLFSTDKINIIFQFFTIK